MENGEIITDKFKISNIFNNHYSDLGEQYASKVPTPENFTETVETLENTMYLYHTNEIEIQSIIKQLKVKKSPGNDDIRAETLKEISSEIAAPLAYLVNTCFDTECFPKSLKIGIIKPLYKSGDKVKVINYRPISLISNIAKIIEKILKVRIVSFLNKYKIISEQQYGFREKRSTEDAIYCLTSYLYNALDKKIPTICIFVDLSKAFDTVSHKILLEKLECYGLRGKIHGILKNYLSDRQQYVKIDNVTSDPRTITYGVPQGTVLGPLLFTIYINSLLTLKTSGTVLSFADDTAILYQANSWENLKRSVEIDFRIISKWFQHNKLTLNCDKTKYLPFTSYVNNLPDMGPLNIDALTQIPEADSVKYLGIIVDRHLRWDLQIQNIIKKIRGLLSRFKYLKQYLDISHLKVLYYALIQSQLSYGILGWGGVSECHLKHLNTMQKWIIKIIYNKNIRYSSDSLYKESQLYDIRQLFCFNILINIRKKKIKLDPVNHKYETRNKENNVTIPKCEKNIGQHSCNYLGHKLYNNLPESIRSVNSFNIYKSKIKKWILETERSRFNNLINLKCF